MELGMPMQRRTPARVSATRQSTPSDCASEPLTPNAGVLVLSGYGMRIAVDHGHLAVSDGIGGDRRVGLLNRVGGGLRRLVVIGHSGTVSLEALRWLHDIGAAFVQIDHDGQLVACFAPLGSDDPRVRRAQALAITNGRDVIAARTLIGRKITTQIEIATTRLAGSATLVEGMQGEVINLDTAPTTNRVRHHEAIAANAYWSAWSGLTLNFGKRTASAVPEHWRVFSSRRSMRNENRRATDPVNAMLNYGYALLEAECRIAALTVGLDPGLGILHTDIRSRDSLALDLMEPLRTEVDGFVLTLIQQHTFNRNDFFETIEGTCRLLPPITRLLATMQPALAHGALAQAETLVKVLTAEDEIERVSHGNSTYRLRAVDPAAAEKRKERATTKATESLPAACLGCGAILSSKERRYCDECVPWKQRELEKARYKAGQATLAIARAEGRDPAHGGQAGKVRGQTNAGHDAANRAWEAEPHPELEGIDFEREILPTIQGVPLLTLVRSTGLSLRYCSLFRRGLTIPHKRHWLSLKDVKHRAD
jgi:CRISPR-associated endonuclease Cas1